QGAETLGYLVAYPDGGREFTPAELQVVQSFSDQAALAVAMRLLVDRQRDAATAGERFRLSAEMHDTVAQSLGALVLQLETTADLLRSQDVEGAATCLETATARARRALQETRRVVQGLPPDLLLSLTLQEAIQRELAILAESGSVTTEFILTGQEQNLTTEQRTALLRIAQESFANISKHAGAARVRAGVDYAEETVTLLVEDNGSGFNPSAVETGSNGGYGLFGMRERARQLGGELVIDSRLGWGTRVVAVIPYRVSAARPHAERAAAAASSSPPESEAQSSATEADPIRVLIVDDHAVTRQGLKSVLQAEQGIVVVGEAGDGAEAIRAAIELTPDVVLMDLQMPVVDGFTAMSELKQAQPDLPVVVLTTFETQESVAGAAKAGAKGYVLKDSPPAELVAAVRAARSGDVLISGSVNARLQQLAAARAEGSAGAEGLHEREMEVLELLVHGARNKEIAARLFISESTVEYHLSNLFIKLGVSNRTEAARVAAERGLTSRPPLK
ncbi:MAG TPA: hybrid sensor histidine kinase/response regulator transcription factor, partial [Chthonomonadales bacterium]|nr:hybrid sensor histidine kinase/response regulator transcription factor [Chthonomonadales bacterium]